MTLVDQAFFLLECGHTYRDTKVTDSIDHPTHALHIQTLRTAIRIGSAFVHNGLL